MALVLRVVSEHAFSMPGATECELGDSAVRLGRATDNDWVFPQDYVSRHQAVIRPLAGWYFIENRSQNCPMSVREAARPLRAGDAELIQGGDRLWIDDIELLVTERFAKEAVADSPGSPEAPDSGMTPLPLPSVVDPLQLLVIGMAEEDDPCADASSLAQVPRPPSLKTGWWVRSADAPGDAAPGAGRPPEMDAFLTGLGLDPGAGHLTADKCHELGRLLRVTVMGLVRLIAARRSVQTELRLERTRLEARANNPLKFAEDELEVVRSLMRPATDGDLDPVEAFEDAFRESMHHQMALLEGLRISFDELLQTLAPANFMSPPRTARPVPDLAGWLPSRKDGDSWARYCARHAEWMKDPEQAYRQLIGNALAEGYEQQASLLKQLRGRVRAGAPAGAKS